MDKEPTDSMSDYGNEGQGDAADVPQDSPEIQDGVLQVADKPESNEVALAETEADGVVSSVMIDETAGSGAPKSPENDLADEVDVTRQADTANHVDSDPDSTSAPEPTSAEIASDPVAQMELAADAAESDAKDIAHIRKVAQNNERHTVLVADDIPASTQPIDVRQDFIDQMHNPKTNHGKGLTTGKKVAIGVVTVLLLAIVGFFTWWFAYYSRPNVVMADAIKHLASSPSVNTSVTTTNTYNYGDSQDTTTVTSTSQMHGLTEFSTHFEFDMSELDDMQDMDDDEMTDEEAEGEARISADVMMLGDGLLFAKIDGLDTMPIEYSVDDELMSEAVKILEGVNGKWYQIDIKEILDLLGVEEGTAKPIEDFYHCAISVAGQDYSKDLKAVYEQNPFLTATKSDVKPTASGITVYDISIDYDVLAGFLNMLPNLGAAESFYVCYNTMAESLGIDTISAGDFGTVKAEDLKEGFPADYSLRAEITNFGHELVRLVVQASSDSRALGMAVDFDYTYREISAPSEYWTVEDFVTAVKELWVILEKANNYDYSAGGLPVNGTDVLDDPNDDDDNEWYDDDDWYYEDDEF